MKLDSDLRWGMIAAIGLLLTNIVLVIQAVHTADWLMAVGMGVCAANCVLWIWIIRSQQRTRDQVRISNAGWSAWVREFHG